MKQTLISHFSKKVLIFSLLFVLANVGLISLRLFSAEGSASQNGVTPTLKMSDSDKVELLTTYESDYVQAKDGQSLYSGSVLRTPVLGSAQIELGGNLIRLDENTEIKILSNQLEAYSIFENNFPRLSIELVRGALWVDAFDLIEVKSPRQVAHFKRAIGLVSYLDSSNRVVSLTNDVDIQLLDENQALLARYNLPLHNQVSFLDAQLVDLYKSLKPSKLKKELKMTTVPQEILDNPWVQANILSTLSKLNDFSDEFIHSSVSYNLSKKWYGLQSLLNFRESSSADLIEKRLSLNLFYFLGQANASRDLELANQLLDEIDLLISENDLNDASYRLLVDVLYLVEDAQIGEPRVILKDYLINNLYEKEGVDIFRIYLTDLRKFLLNKEVERSLSVLNKWEKIWSDSLIESNFSEYERQSQILNHTIMSLSDHVNIAILTYLDTTGVNRIEFSEDQDETRFEVTQERLGIASRLVADYRYSLAKQYLKQSYLSLDISNFDQETPSAKIFLENGRLLAQRIEYAENVLDGAARAIDETKFREYFQARTEEEQLSSNLETFLEIETTEEVEVLDVASLLIKMTDRFIQAGVALDLSKVVLVDGSDSKYIIEAARLNQRDSSGRLITFNALYDVQLDALTDVSFGQEFYKGPFILEDLILLLTNEGDIQAALHQDVVEVGDLLSTDQENSEASRGQALAQDLAIKLAVNQLAEFSVVVQNVKDDIKVIDSLNLDKFSIKGALLMREDDVPLEIDFNFYSSIAKVTDVRSSEGVLLLPEVSAEDLAGEITSRLDDLENEIELVADFSVFALQNELEILDENIIYTPEGYLVLNDLTLLTINQSVTGLYDPISGEFLSVSNPFAAAENIALKAYFKQLANSYVKALLLDSGLVISSRQIESAYPFRDIVLRSVEVGNVSFDLTFDPLSGHVDEVSYLDGSESILVEGRMSLDELKVFEESLVVASDETSAEVPAEALGDLEGESEVDESL